MEIGVVSDTHGRLARGVLPALAGVELILHAGDIGNEMILGQLETIAPVLAIHGNTDQGALARAHPANRWIEREGVLIYMTHIGGQPRHLVQSLPKAADGRLPQVYIFGHSHRPLCEMHNSVLFLNPGTAGAPRGAGLSVARLTVANGQASAVIVEVQ
ncbi:metallophosphoesterase family protein [Chloroflexus sp.]|uniref:metallophosphoesterase family protein n=1 Tax=Chloroflexus sp. TaxID=1904827 RepID=UPI00298F10B1|nr:metallophosphoesterase family protein [Chloroflexus sp.]MCX7860064.1 metallophosphatase family protein [Chloroflexus sp.]MDW8403839.1 metallophosphoesterase family protein [Chloroflexus sp.]